MQAHCDGSLTHERHPTLEPGCCQDSSCVDVLYQHIPHECFTGNGSDGQMQSSRNDNTTKMSGRQAMAGSLLNRKMEHLSNPEARRKSTNGERERVVAFGKVNSITLSARRTCNHSILPANMVRSRWRAGTRVACLSKLRKSVGPHLDHSSQLSDQSRQYHDGIQPVHWKRDTAILAYTGQRYQQVDIFLHTITSTLTSTSTLQSVSVSGGLVPSCTSVSPVTIVATQSS